MLRLALCGLAVVMAMGVGIAQAASVQYVYDELGRLVAEVDAAGELTVYTYDAAGNLTSVSRREANELSLVSFSPARGKAGDSVTLYGSGFSPTPADNGVSFNGTPAVVTSSTPTSLVVTVPAGVTSGTVAVSNSLGSVTSTQVFTVVFPPVIEAISPAIVQRGVTLPVEITGSQLGGATAVTFSHPGLGAVVQPGGTSTSLRIEITADPSMPVGTYAFAVTAAGGTSDSGAVGVEVTTALLGEALSASRPLSVHVPATTPGAPGGNRMSAARSVSVHLPAITPGAPDGNAMSASRALSVHLPAATPGAPAGNAMSVTLAVSVSMP